MPTVTTVPENVTTHTSGTPLHTPDVVGADAWDADTSSYSFTASTEFGSRFAYTQGDIPTTAIDAVAAGTLLSLTCYLTAKYDDDDALATTTPSLTILLGTGTDRVSLCRQDEISGHRDAFHVDDANQNDYVTNTWAVLNSSTTLATPEQIALAFSQGVVTVASPLVASMGNPFSTYATTYALSFAAELEGPAATASPHRRIFGRAL
jgi:hypothetical protein